jgi:hypothetical protein
MKTKYQQFRVRASMDRAVFLAWVKTDDVPTLRGFKVSRNFRVQMQTKVRTYSRVTISASATSGTKAYLQHEASGICKAPMKLTLVPADSTGMLPAELWCIEQQFKRLRPLNLEIPIEFAPETGVDSAFVEQHGRFGRTKVQRGHRGSRRGDILIRAYDKPQTGSFRIEVELHSSWLRRHGIRRISDFPRLRALLVPKHFKFVEVDWNKLTKSIRHARENAEEIIRQCRLREASLDRLTAYLRNELGLVNTHRWFRRLPINEEIEKALLAWAQKWVKPERRLAQ